MNKHPVSRKNHKDKVISLNDWHVPFHDPRVVELQLAFCREEQPKIIILHELHDFYDVSRYDKDPSRKENLQDELDMVENYIRRLREYCPRSRIVFITSNHLDRLKKYLWSKAPALHSLRALNIKSLLNLDKYRVEFKTTFIYKKVLFKHGEIVRRYSSYTARAEFEKEGMSGNSGHTHRLGVYFHRLRGGSYVWVESGCACDLNPEYIEGIANWQHGFSVFGFDRKGNHFYPTVVPIIDYRIDWGSKTYIG